jgi:hypothetical protein
MDSKRDKAQYTYDYDGNIVLFDGIKKDKLPQIQQIR